MTLIEEAKDRIRFETWTGEDGIPCIRAYLEINLETEIHPDGRGPAIISQEIRMTPEHGSTVKEILLGKINSMLLEIENRTMKSWDGGEITGWNFDGIKLPEDAA